MDALDIPTLATERLRLRPLRGSDFENYAALYADPEVTRFIGNNGETWDRARAWRHMAFAVGHWQLEGTGVWVEEEKATGAFVGMIGFWEPATWPGFELSGHIARRFWGQGYASEGARAAMLLNPVREARLELRAQHLLAELLCAAGRAPEALAIMDRARPLYGEFQEDIVQLRLHWLQGRIARGLGTVAEAVDILRQVREEFRARDLHQDFLFASIDLAESHVAAGEVATALRLFGETTPYLANWSLHRNGLAAWLLFQETLEERRDLGGAALVPLFDNLRRYYRRYWHVPVAEFSLG